MRRTPPILVIAVVALTGLSALASPDESRGVTEAGAPRAALAATTAPNVLLIVTDDQRYDTLWAMPNVRNLLGAHGVTFTDAVVSNPLCCPSRATILTGTYSHTNDVWRNGPPHGGFPSFDDSATLATTLDAAGYRTGIFGKYLNLYRRAAPDYVPPGWDRWFVFDAPAYYGYRVIDGRSFRSFGHRPADYSTTVLADEAISFIEEGTEPFFAYFAPYAPHGPSTPAPSDERAPMGKRVAPDGSFNEADVSDKPAWARGLRLLGPSRIAAMHEAHRDHVRSLLEVDRSVGRLVDALIAQGELRNTIIVFTSDNGLAFGEHRWSAKRIPYEESIRVPLVIRYDALETPADVRSSALVANIDIAPTIAALTGVTLRRPDGVSLVPQLRDPRAAMARQGVLLEHLAKKNDRVPSYCGLRTTRHTYVRYATGEEELYNLDRDQFQLANRSDRASAKDALRKLRHLTRSLCGAGPPDPAFRWEG